ncbi:hypothetical protein J7T55_000532 [Diaporthe amygdali]|uniref:uncharacterized protein n=1 Tax=Phomopsis amygdali TaxID=1214568 RepID=UPI0022FE4B47|nr:uncharacterized protein J7T55_000532 [Diaporthe amygdali]KAJ0104181.1 hypothetical protein J7T55_000532 [Diaporthe amygdali]
MDPLVAAAASNRELSLLLKLPDEILLVILQLLLPDVRDLFYIRRVCRKLRHLTDDNSLRSNLFWTNWLQNIRPASHMLFPDRFVSRENNRSSFGIVPPLRIPEFEANLRKQTLCKPEGRLRLCEHVSIDWADIEAHLMASSRKEDFFEAVSDFHIVCKDPSHNFPCKSTSRGSPSEASCNDHTWPCARLSLNRDATLFYMTPITLVLCWKPHSSSRILTVPENGQLEATKLRELYNDYGQNAARFIVPGPSQAPIPEMLCFDPDKCGHVLYRAGQKPQSGPWFCSQHHSGKPGPLAPTEILLDEDHQDVSRFAGLGWTDHYVEFNEARGQSGVYVYDCDDDHNVKDGARCLMTSYRRTISLGAVDSRRPEALNPSHQWFHAIDQDSYPSTQAEGGLWSKLTAYFRADPPESRPRCRDTACRNYYQSPGPWHEDNMHWPHPDSMA